LIELNKIHNISWQEGFKKIDLDMIIAWDILKELSLLVMVMGLKKDIF